MPQILFFGGNTQYLKIKIKKIQEKKNKFKSIAVCKQNYNTDDITLI